jgi:transcriptional regulator with XRE-family HTH domain
MAATKEKDWTDRLRAVMAEKGLTQGQVAQRTGIPAPRLCEWLSDRHADGPGPDPKLSVLVKLVRGLDLDPRAFLPELFGDG